MITLDMNRQIRRAAKAKAAAREAARAMELARQAAEFGTIKKPLYEKKGGTALGAWFLGPKAENIELFERLIRVVIEAHRSDRETDYKDDPPWITDDRKETRAYKRAVNLLEAKLKDLVGDLKESVPFFSYRYQGHMLWDVTLPSVLGYFAAMLYNQNNVAAEASPVTTQLEMRVGDDLCKMLGYHAPKQILDEDGVVVDSEIEEGKIRAWGHITCDGSVANMEAMWCARNLKYYPLGLAAALRTEPELQPALGLDVRLASGELRVLAELDTWQLFNLKADDVLNLPSRLTEEYGILDVDDILEGYTLQELGFLGFRQQFAPKAHDPVILAPATMHYSWPKGAALLGLGRASVKFIPVDLDGRMDAQELRRRLDTCLRDRRPVIMVVAVLGTTQESAVDPLASILEMREAYRAKGLEFWLHVDAAWGGYFASMLREPIKEEEEQEEANTRFFHPRLAMSKYVNDQYEVLGEVDSITVDPHKAGYIPYPAGGLCYRNSAMRHLVAFTAPVVYKGETDPTVGVYGIEGSKPGAAAAATYLSHRVIRPDKSGYGRILSRCLWNSKRFYANLVTMAEEEDPFIIVPFQRLPVQREKPDWSDEDVKEELDRIRTEIVPKSDDELMLYLEKGERRRWFRNLGSDQVIVSYAFNFKFERDGEWILNADVERLNKLNTEIFKRLSILRPKSHNGKTAESDDPPPLFVTSSAYDPGSYGTKTIDLFKRRLGIVDHTDEPVDVLISTTMDPWLTDTETGNIIPELIKGLREVVLKEVENVIKKNP